MGRGSDSDSAVARVFAQLCGRRVQDLAFGPLTTLVRRWFAQALLDRADLSFARRVDLTGSFRIFHSTEESAELRRRESVDAELLAHWASGGHGTTD